MFSACQQLWAGADAATRQRALLLLALMAGSMALEMIGVGAVLPVVGLLVGDTAAGAGMDTMLRRIGLTPADARAAITATMALLVLFFAIKGVFQAVVAGRIARFTFDLQAQFSRQLLMTYLHQPYPFHLGRNSAQLGSAVNNEARDAATAVNTILSVVAEGMVLIGIVTLLLVVSPAAGLMIAALIGAVGALILWVTRAGMVRQGARMRTEHALKMQMMQQALHGVKELIVLGRQETALAQFDVHNRAHADAARRQATIMVRPRLWLEFLAVTGLALLILTMHGRGTQAVLPLVAVFAAAAFRLIPSINRIVGGVQSLNYLTPTLDHVIAELALPLMHADADAPAIRLTDALVLDGVSYRYPGGGAAVLDRLSVRLEQGTMTGLVGTSGAGKTSVIDIIIGLLSPDTGQVLVDGRSIATARRSWQSQIGYVPQHVFLTDDTLRRNIAFAIPDADIDDMAVRRALRLAQIDGLADALPQGLDTMMGDRGQRLSGGQRQRVAIARALYHQPALLVMDEGTSALDAETEADVIRTVQALRGSVTIIVATHRETVLGGCDQVIRIAGGGATSVG